MFWCNVLLDIIEEKLNLMIFETFQCTMNGIKLNFENHEKLILIILREVAMGHIQSAHMSNRFARNALSLYSDLKYGKTDFIELCDKMYTLKREFE